MNKKSIAPIVIVIALLVIGAGAYMGYLSFEDKKTAKQTNTAQEQPQGVYSTVGEYPAETALIPQNQLPADIFPEQVIDVVDDNYAVVVKPSSHYAHIYTRAWMEKNKTTDAFSGVLKWNEEKQMWEKMLKVEDVDTDISRDNNITKLSFVGAAANMNMRLLVLDTEGAGSGEGIAKEMVPVKSDLSAWKVAACYYYASDTGKMATPAVKSSSKECQNAVRVTSVESEEGV